jgi:DegV family protein with EDD domain
VSPFSYRFLAKEKKKRERGNEMRKVGLVIDSTFGVDKAYAKKHHITVVPLKVLIEDREYIDGNMSPAIVVEALHAKLHVKTSQPAPELFISAYQDQLVHYEEVLCLTLSKTLSGTYNSATLAQTELSNQKVVVVDTETTINGGDYIVQEMIKFLEKGKNLEEALVFLEEVKNKGSLVFTVDNLQTLARNGRLGRVQAVIGNILKVKPILRFEKGVLDLEHKVRSFANVIVYIVKEAEKLLEFGEVVVRIAYVDQEEMAKQLEEKIKELGGKVVTTITGVISPVVAAHVGLGGLGVYITNI